VPIMAGTSGATEDVGHRNGPLHVGHRDGRLGLEGLGFGVAEAAVEADDGCAGGQDIEDQPGHAVPGGVMVSAAHQDAGGPVAAGVPGGRRAV
jgi:hypothetical protein